LLAAGLALAPHPAGLLEAPMVCGEGFSPLAVEHPVRAAEFVVAELAGWF